MAAGQTIVVLGAGVLALAVLGLGFLCGWLVNRRRGNRLQSSRDLAARILEEARGEAEALKKTAALEAKDDWRRQREPLEREQESTRRSLRRFETDLQEREQQLDRKVDVLESKERSLLKLSLIHI